MSYSTFLQDRQYVSLEKAAYSEDGVGYVHTGFNANHLSIESLFNWYECTDYYLTVSQQSVPSPYWDSPVMDYIQEVFAACFNRLADLGYDPYAMSDLRKDFDRPNAFNGSNLIVPANFDFDRLLSWAQCNETILSFINDGYTGNTVSSDWVATMYLPISAALASRVGVSAPTDPLS